MSIYYRHVANLYWVWLIILFISSVLIVRLSLWHAMVWPCTISLTLLRYPGGLDAHVYHQTQKCFCIVSWLRHFKYTRVDILVLFNLTFLHCLLVLLTWCYTVWLLNCMYMIICCVHLCLYRLSSFCLGGWHSKLPNKVHRPPFIVHYQKMSRGMQVTH